MGRSIGCSVALAAFMFSGCGGADVEVQSARTQAGVTTPPSAPPAAVTVQARPGPGGLVIGGSASNFGRFSVTPGFLPDPQTVSVTSGGDIDARTLNLGEGCVGWVTRQPDYIFDLTSSSAMLRIYVTSDQAEDTTLLINDGEGTWRCNDDSYGARNPTVDIANASPGHYDVWVGSYRQGVQAHGQLHITELPQNHP